MTMKIEFPFFVYNPQKYNTDSIRGTDIDPRPYNLETEILSRMPSNGTLLDIGCGSATKLLPLSHAVKSIIGIDKNPNVISQAKRFINQLQVRNMYLAVGDGAILPIPADSIDMVTYMLSPHDSKEAMRVLKKGGYILADRVGEHDKSEIKQFFIDENNNPRGYRTDMPDGEIAKAHTLDFQRAGFQEVVCQDQFWRTNYTKEGLWLLLNSTPTIKNFCGIKDREIFEHACSKLSTPEGIILTQHRVLVTARK